MRTPRLGRELFVILITITALFMRGGVARAQQPDRPTFRSTVAVVPITAVVRDSHSRPVRNLTREDFRVLERGALRQIVQFSANDDGPVSVAFLFDTSGSMGLVSNFARGREVIGHLLEGMRPARDEAALFTFHKTLREEVPFTSNLSRIQAVLDEVRPWGLTSLYDAVAQTAERLNERVQGRRAIIVVSDGVDTSSALSPQQVARLASDIDVPVYVVAVVSPLDQPSRGTSAAAKKTGSGLSELAEQTGGDVYYVSVSDSVATTDRLLTTMRHQYFLAIESAPVPGWYPLEVQTTRKGFTVRARRAYSSE